MFDTLDGGRYVMELFKSLFADSVGLLTLGTVLVLLAIPTFIFFYIVRAIKAKS